MVNLKKEVVVEKKAYEKFIAWAKRFRYIVDERDFDKGDLLWKAWYSAWSSSRAVYLDQQVRQYRVEISEYLLTDEEKRKLWNGCSSGKDYAERIEHAVLRKIRK